MRSRFGALAVACVIGGTYAAASAAEDPYATLGDRLTRCRAVAVDAERLKCYDNAMDAALEALRAEVAHPIAVADFLVDESKYQGQTIVLRGVVSCLSTNYCVIASPENALQGVMFDMSELRRDDRLRLLQCNALDHCVATLRAEVAATGVMTTLRVSDIWWR
jgi:hypothetical protein